MVRATLASVLLLLLFLPRAAGQEAFRIETQGLVLEGVRFPATLTALDASGALDTSFAGDATLEGAFLEGADGPDNPMVTFRPQDGGVLSLERLLVRDTGSLTIRVASGPRSGEARVRSLPGFTSVVPPLLAILLAVLFRQVIIALVLGILMGALLVHDMDPVRMLFSFSDTYVVRAFIDPDHAKIIIFSMMLGGMVGVISRCGGTYGIVNLLTRFARTRRSGQVSTAALGSAVFFDDYANCLIVGNTMRPLTDRLRISREKLAYIVDSTAAPVASLVPLSTWVGTQVGLVGDALDKLAGGYHVSAYPMVLAAIPYMFYPIFALVLVFAIGLQRRDMFTMYTAEKRVVETGKVLRDGAQPLSAGEEDASIQPKEGAPQRAFNALLPILAVIVVTILGLYLTGSESAQLGNGLLADMRAVIEQADSYEALLWASLSGLTLAILLAVVQRILAMEEAVTAALSGMKAMLLAMVILILSWSLGDVTGELHAKDFLAHQLSDTIAPAWLPILVFVLAAFTAFATGSSWGTMGILVPLVVPLAHGLSIAASIDPDRMHVILLGSIASVLGGAVFGDHCSPISDTTVLSSTATSCDHIDHVRTQMPYAILAALFAVLAGYVPAALGLPIAVSLPIGLVLLIVFVRLVGRIVPDPGPGSSPRKPGLKTG